MVAQIQLGDFSADVFRKDIQNVHLSVYPPTGRVRIAAPSQMSLDKIRVYAISKLGWIKAQQEKQLNQVRETPREYLERESHYLWGKRYLLKLSEENARPKLELTHNYFCLSLRPDSKESKSQNVIETFYREKLKEEIPKMIDRWKELLGVQVTEYQVRKMKTKWGSCIPEKGKIMLNLELAKKPKECLEYIVVHEMVHLIEPTHNERFQSLMNTMYPQWKLHRKILNDLPLSHRDWRY